MSLLDVLILVSTASAVVGGYRLGFLARITSWTGLAVGVLLGTLFVDDVARYFVEAERDVRVLAVVAFLVASGMLGQGVGLALGAALHASLRVGPGLRHYDRLAGSALGAAGVLAVFWLLAPSLGAVQGWMAREARESVILQLLADLGPQPPETLGTIKRLFGDGFFPDVFADLQRAPDAGPPPAASGISPEIHARVVASTVKVEGQACRKVQEGSGFVAGPDIVVTNAHVVAGESETRVERNDGREFSARVVAFDPNRDLAVLHVPGIGRDPLPTGTGTKGTQGAVYGHPGGGPLEVSPAQVADRVAAVGTDIYDIQRTRRDVFILAAELRAGDSGGPFVDQTGTVVGVAFAIAPDRPNTAYALTNRELEPVLRAVTTQAVDTGPCLI